MYRKKVGFERKRREFEEFSSNYADLIKDSKFRKFWKIVKQEKLLKQKKCLYCEKDFIGDKGAVLHHHKMPIKEKAAADQIKDLKFQIDINFISKEEGQKIIEDIENNLIDYYKSLKETHLICKTCHANDHLGLPGKKTYIQEKLA